MQIQRCIANKTGILDNKELVFNDPVTLVYGKNNSGKSLIVRAIIDTIWGAFSNSQLLNGKTWDNMQFEIVFINCLNQYKFIRDGMKLFSIKRIDELKETDILNYSIDELNSGQWEQLLSGFSSLTCDENTGDLFKKIDLEIFRNMCYIPSPEEIKDGRFDYKTYQLLMLNDNSNLFDLYQFYNKKIDNEDIGKAFNNEILSELLRRESELKDLDKKIQIIDIQDSKNVRLNNDAERLREEIDELDEELNDIRLRKHILHKIQKDYKALENLKDQINEKKVDISEEEDKQRSYSDLIKETDEQFKQFSNFNDNNLENLKEIEKAYKKARKNIEEIEKSSLKIKNRKRKFIKIILYINSYFLLIFAIFMIFKSASMPMLKFYRFYFIGSVLTISGIVSSITGLLYYLSNRTNNRDLKILKEEREEIEKNLKSLLEENDISLDEYRLEAIYEFLVQYFEEYGEYSIRKSDLDNMKQSLKDEKYIKDLKKELKDLEEEEKEAHNKIDTELMNFGDIGEEDIELDSISKIITNLNYKLKSTKEMIKNKEENLSQIVDEIEKDIENRHDRDEISIERTKAQESLNKLQTYNNTVSFIIDILKEAVKNREEKQLSDLINIAQEKFSFLTNGQYEGSINENLISDIITGREYDEDISPSLYHLILISIKIAGTFLLTDIDISLPLIIDEPFLYMDEIRIGRLQELLYDLAEKRQIIIFTHNNNYRDWGNYIEL